MAILKGGALHGKVGNLIYYVRNGQPCVRSLPKPITKPPTPVQQAQRLRMKLATQFLAPLAPMLNDTFKANDRKSMSGLNRATRRLLQDAIAGEFPDLYVQPEQVLVSRGALPRMYNPELALTDGGVLTLTWTQTDPSFIDNDDLVFLLVYNQSSRQVVVSEGTAHRGDGQLRLSVDQAVLNGTVYCYGFLMDRLRRSASNSVFLGTLVDGGKLQHSA